MTNYHTESILEANRQKEHLLPFADFLEDKNMGGLMITEPGFVGGESLFHYDQVQERISKIQASYTVCSAMCVNSSEKAGIEQDMAPHGMEAIAVKSVITDFIQEAAQSLLQRE